MHLFVVRRELYEKYPFSTSSLYEAFDKPKIVGLGRAKQLDMMLWLPEALDDIEGGVWG